MKILESLERARTRMVQAASLLELYGAEEMRGAAAMVRDWITELKEEQEKDNV